MNNSNTVDLIAVSIENIFAHVDSPAGVLVPTSSGYMARSLTRFRLPVWIIAVSTSLKACSDLMFSYGVYPIHEESTPKDWVASAKRYIKNHGFKGSCFIKAEGPSPDHPNVTHKMEIIELDQENYENTGTTPLKEEKLFYLARFTVSLSVSVFLFGFAGCAGEVVEEGYLSL